MRPAKSNDLCHSNQITVRALESAGGWFRLIAKASKHDCPVKEVDQPADGGGKIGSTFQSDDLRCYGNGELE